MCDLRDFLQWFSGWSENIDGRPTDKQWLRLLEKINALSHGPPGSNGAAVSATVTAVVASTSPVPAPSWSDQFIDRCVALGLDGASAAALLAEQTADPATDPKQAAKTAVNEWNRRAAEAICHPS